MLKNNFAETYPLEDLNVPITSRIAVILSYKPSFSKLLLIFMFLIYQLENFTIVFKPTAHNIKTDPEASYRIFNNIYNTVYFEELEIVTRSSDNILSILGVMGIYLVLDISLVLHTVIVLYRRKKLQKTIERLCNALAYIHQLILFCLIHVFCCKILYVLSRGEDLILSSEDSILHAKIVCFFVIVINSTWCLMKILIFTINIRTKDPLSSKTNAIALLDFIFRVTLPLFEAFALPEGTFIYPLLVANIVYSLLRDYLLFYFLPYYQLPTLKGATISHAVITSFAFTALLSRPISQSRSYSELEFLIPLSIISIIVLVKLYTRYLNMLLRTILVCPDSVTIPYHLIHYLRIYKVYAKCSQPATNADTVKEKYFIYKSIVKQTTLSDLLSETEKVKPNHKAQFLIDQHFIKSHINLLNKALKKTVKSSILKATLAHYYMKYEKLYVLADQILDRNFQDSFSIKNSAFLLKMQIWQKLRNEDSKQNVTTVQKHVRLQEMYKNMKIKIIDQLKKEVQFWRDFQERGTDFSSLTTLADEVSKKSRDIKKSAIHYQVFQEANFVDPLLIYSLYFFFAQNDVVSAQKLFKEYSQSKLKKIQVSNFEARKESKMFSFTSESLFFTLSTSQEHFGTTLDCSGQALKTLGAPKEMLIKRQLSSIMPQSYAKWYDDLLKDLVFNTNFERLNKAIEIPIMMKDGYIMHHWMHLTLNYTNEFGLCLSGLLRPIKDYKRIALIMKNGLILNVSREFAEDMNIEFHKDRNSGSIYNFCPSLEDIVQNLLDAQKEDEIVIPEIQLQFFPYLGSHTRIDIFSASEINKQIIDYIVKIRMFNIQGTPFIDLRMETSTATKVQSSLLTKTSITHTTTAHNPVNSYMIKATLQESAKKLEPTKFQNYRNIYGLQKKKSSIYMTKSNETLRFEMLDSPTDILKSNRRETIELNNNQPSLISPTSVTSERKKFLFSPKGDTDIDVDIDLVSNEKRSQKDLSSISFDKEMGRRDDKVALDFLSVSDGSSTSTAYNVRKIDAYKVARQAIDSRAYRRSGHAYNLCFIATITVQMTFLIWLNIYTSTVSKNVGKLSQVIQSSYFRSYWIKISNQDVLLWAGVRGSWYNYDVESLREGFTYDFLHASQYNEDLENYLSALDNEMQIPFYQKNVRIQERDSLNNLQLMSVDNTFEATKRIVNYGIINSNKPEQNFSGLNIVDHETTFIADNSLNDLMIVSEELTSFVEDKLFSTLTNAKKIMIAALFVGITVLILFILISLVSVIYVNKDATSFMELLFTLPADEVARTEYYLSTFKELLEKDASDTEILEGLHGMNSKLQRKATQKENTVGNAKASRKILHRASMKKFKTKNYLIFAGLFLCLGLMTTLMAVYYHLANNKIVVMERQHIGLNSALNFVNIMAYTIPQALVVPLWNDTTTVENMPAFQFLKESIGNLRKVRDFENSLEDSNGNISPVQQDILLTYSCEKAYTPYYSWSLEVLEPECESISDGLGYIGLIKLVMALEDQLNQYVYDFENSPRNSSELISLYSFAFTTCNYTDIGFVLSLQSFAYSLQTFADLVVELEDERVILAWVAVVLSIALGAMTWMFIIRRLIRKEFEKKRVLALVPNKLIFGSYLLTKYITNLK